jgi:chromosome segregation ATPase
LQALEQDLADLKGRADSADALQQQLELANQQLQAHGAEQAALQQELSDCRSRIANLEFDLHGMLTWCCCG